jgi:vesicle coat complex subunit
MYEIKPEKVEEFEFLPKLIEMMADGNGMVVSNAVAALTEIQNQKGGENLISMTDATLHKLLNALPECSEWGRVYILDCLG